MRRFIWRWPQRLFSKGQALAEYSIIVAIIAIASIAVVTIFGKQIRSLFAGSSKQLAGDEAAAPDDKTAGVDGTVEHDINEW